MVQLLGSTPHIAEWPVIALWLSYILLLGFATRRLGLPVGSV
jgi:hypothetical protein